MKMMYVLASLMIAFSISAQAVEKNQVSQQAIGELMQKVNDKVKEISSHIQELNKAGALTDSEVQSLHSKLVQMAFAWNDSTNAACVTKNSVLPSMYACIATKAEILLQDLETFEVRELSGE